MKNAGSSRGLISKILPVALMVGAFLFFIARDPEEETIEGPEEVLLNMAVALGDGQAEDFVACFGGDLGRSLRAIVARNDEQKVSNWLRDRGAQIKGFAITEVEAVTPDEVLVTTETIYEDRNSGQKFKLALEGTEWLITESDFETIEEWESDFGKSVWEIQ